MQSPEDKLRAEDPFFEHPYEHPDLEGMISRITAAPRVAVGSVRRFKVRMVGAGIVATLLAIGGVTTLDALSTPPATTLLFAGPALVAPRTLPSPTGVTALDGSSKYLAAVSASPQALLVPPGTYRFVAGPSVSRLSTSGVGYRITNEVSGAVEARVLASHFHVPGPVRAASSQWTVGTSRTRVVGFDVVGGLPTFFYNVHRDGATASRIGAPVPADQMPGPAAVASEAQSLVRSLGFAYQLSTLSYGTSWTNPRFTPCAEACSEVDALFEVRVGGADTGQQLQLAVDQRGRVVSASGPVIRHVAAYEFPLRSPASGVAALAQTSPWNVAARVNSGTPNALPPRFTVQVQRAVRAVALYRTSNGELWLLPTYGYAGSVAARHQPFGFTPDTLSVLAVSPAHLRPSPSGQHGAPQK